ncbi:MAG TPA: CPBP family intramembrane glutamic endopeptidase [Planctomycetaceae bacterium]|nr:CPBP family intramembrane glutamic endopeptidase [Planctomycetaceae bacterium]
MTGFDALLLGLAAGSLAVWAQVLIRWRQGQPLLPAHGRYPPAWSPVALWLTLCWSALSLEQQFAGAKPAVVSLERVQQSCLESAAVLAILLLVLSHAGARGLSDFGMRSEQWPLQIAIGGAAFLASVLPVAAVLWATRAWRSADTQHPLLQLLAREGRWDAVIWVGLAAVVLAPLLEELMYRVILQGTCERFVRPPLAVVGVALVFSAVHNVTDILPLVPLALILGYVYHRTRSYLAVVTAHALFNLAMLLLSLTVPEARGPVDPLVPPVPDG